jgi:DNA polymerase-1
MLLAVDIETYDPNLKTMGDGSCRHDGTMLCASTYDGATIKGYRFNSEDWEEFVRVMEDPSVDKIFHNGIYDLSWLVCNLGINVKGILHDTMTRQAYINEYSELSLDKCCRDMNVKGKIADDTIEKWWEEHKYMLFDKGVIRRKKSAMRNERLWDHADVLFNAYNEFAELMLLYNGQDCVATYNLYMAQSKWLNPEVEEYKMYMIDTELVPLVLRMKQVGIRVDTEVLKELDVAVGKDIATVQMQLEQQYGITPAVINSSKQLGERLNAMGIHSPIVSPKTGKESWNAVARSRINHPVMTLIDTYKVYYATLHKYLRGDMTNSILHDGRIHCTFTPNKREDAGTVTGRFSCVHPNMQNIPARSKNVEHDYAQKMRELFLPEPGYILAAMDYSQIEYLLLAHYATGPQAEWFREQAKAGVDFHTVAMDATGIPVRNVVKTFNYGIIYGMGWRKALNLNYALFSKAAADHNKTPEAYAKDVYNEYHKRLPVIKDTMNYVQDQARMYGYVRTIGGRKQHKPRPQYDSATGKVQDYIYKMLNKLIQGSAADILKVAMRDCMLSGVFDVVVPHLTVHDELVVSAPYNEQGAKALSTMKSCMENAFSSMLKVPMHVNVEAGANWGYWSSDIWEGMLAGDFSLMKA